MTINKNEVSHEREIQIRQAIVLLFLFEYQGIGGGLGVNKYKKGGA